MKFKFLQKKSCQHNKYDDENNLMNHYYLLY